MTLSPEMAPQKKEKAFISAVRCESLNLEKILLKRKGRTILPNHESDIQDPLQGC